MVTVLLAGAFAVPAVCQPSGQAEQGEQKLSGTVTSASRTTMVVRTEEGVYKLFVFDQDTIKPRTIATGSQVTVTFVAGSEPGVSLARYVSVSDAPSAPSATAPKPQPEPVPAGVRQLERDIERQARRYGAGFRAGAALDPEVLLVGVHGRVGPFFTRDLSFRPNVEFGFGEVTKLFAINLEAVYRLPFTPRQGRWSAYVGGGPGFFFKSQDFERAASGENSVDFDDFNFEAGLNILTGVEFRNGLFFEAKTTVYASPHFRMIFGYNF
jgi:hypothetical protein